MEDAATAEISRAQIWQWIQHPAGRFADGAKITAALVASVLEDELSVLRANLGDAAYTQSKFDAAADLFLKISTAPQFVEFLTLPAYAQLD
jgi:malate synthase